MTTLMWYNILKAFLRFWPTLPIVCVFCEKLNYLRHVFDNAEVGNVDMKVSW